MFLSQLARNARYNDDVCFFYAPVFLLEKRSLSGDEAISGCTGLAISSEPRDAASEFPGKPERGGKKGREEAKAKRRGE